MIKKTKHKSGHPSLTNNSEHRVRSAVLVSDVVVGLADVFPTHVFGKRRCVILRHIGHIRTIEEPFVGAGRV